MKTINKYIMLLFTILAFASCENDGEKLYVSPLEDTDLIATKTNIVLQSEQAKQLVLSFAWTGQSLSISNPDYSLPSILKTTFMVSVSEDMTSAIETPEVSNSKSYTGSELNILTKNLGLEANVSHPVYFCVKYSVGDNTKPVLSNVVKVNVSPYFIDMRYASILDGSDDRVETGSVFFSKEENGVYHGFVGAKGWEGFFLREGNGTLWGNTPEAGTEFFITSAEDCWNMWYPGMNGCYYTTVDTKKSIWSTIFVSSLSISGDLSGVMKYERKTNKWSLPFTANGNGINIKISGLGNKYTTTTSTTDDDAIPVNLIFGGEYNNMEFIADENAINAQDVNIPVTAVGDCVLYLDLNDSENFKFYIEEGAPEPEPEPLKWAIWIGGLVDGFNGGTWTYDNFLRLDDEDTKTYVGVQAVNSQWGYKFFTESTWDSDSYGTDSEATVLSGNLVAGSAENIPAPEAGTYFMKASLLTMDYSLTKITSVDCAGVNDDWDMREMTEKEPGVYTITLEFTKPYEWGFKIYLNKDWAMFYGGSEGTLYHKSSIMYDDSFIGTTKVLTVDFNKGIYSFD